MPKAQSFATERLRFRHLQLIRAVASTRSLRKAAMELGITQPAATKLLVEVEKGFEAQLFIRSVRGVSPTDTGLAFIHSANAMLAECETVREEMRAMVGGRYSKVRVGMFAVAASEIVSEAILWLQQSTPNFAARIEEGAALAMLSAVRRGDLDCAIGRAPADVAIDVPHFPFRHERVAFMARRSHPLAKRKRLRLQHVANADWILPNREALLPQALETALTAQGLHLPRHVLECSAFSLNQAFVEHTDALCPVPYSLVRRLQTHNKLCTLPVTLTIAMPPVVLWTRQPPPYRPSLHKFINAVTEAARRLADSLPVTALR